MGSDLTQRQRTHISKDQRLLAKDIAQEHLHIPSRQILPFVATTIGLVRFCIGLVANEKILGTAGKSLRELQDDAS